MSQLAVGIIETIGLAACIEAADACVKSANVNLIGYELSKGAGMAVLKVEGDVGAVKASIDAGVVAANKVSKVFSYKVIPRPSDQIENLIKSNDTVGYTNESTETPEESIIEDILEEEQVYIEDETFQQGDNGEQESSMENDYIGNDHNQDNEESYTCNICKDPKCSRQKGELKTSCIHNSELNDN